MPSRLTHTWLWVLTWVVFVAQGSAPSSTTSLRGVVFDPTNRLVPGTKLTLTDASGRQRQRDTTTDGQGGYEFTGVEPGRYRLEATRQGFRTQTSDVTLAGATELSLRLSVGSLRESIEIAASFNGQSPRSSARRAPSDVPLQDNQDAAAAKQCAAGRLGRIGGLIVSPKKVAHVSPLFPTEMRVARMASAVVIRATIETDGSVSNTSAAPDAHRAFVESAVAAVRQWRFVPAMLNCEPVTVEMQVFATFNPNR